MHIELAQNDGAGGTQARNDRCILRCHLMAVVLDTARGGPSGHIDIVLHCDRHTGQWPTHAPRGTLAIDVRRGLPSASAVNRNKRLDTPVEGIDPRQIMLERRTR